MIKNIYFTVILLFSSISIACSNNNQAIDPSTQNSLNQEIISSKDIEIIKKSNEILEKLATDDLNDVQKQLKDFIPQALKISNKKERNLVLMNIYTQTKMYPEALKLNSFLLDNNPNNVSAQKFQCLLIKTLDQGEKKTKTCYVSLANLIKKQLDTTPINDPLYQYIEWSYYSAMYHAGNDEFQKKLKTIAYSQKNKEKELQFMAMYDSEMSEQRLP